MRRQEQDGRARRWARRCLAAVYALAGLLHIIAPRPFLSITPDWVPWAEQVVQLTGLAEIAGAVGLFVPRLRRAAGVGLAIYAACVYPANVKHAVDQAIVGGETLSWIYHGPRLALQPVIVWWALWAAGVIDWPIGRRSRARTSGRLGAMRKGVDTTSDSFGDDRCRKS
jgi:uncharacterized membrane protein